MELRQATGSDSAAVALLMEQLGYPTDSLEMKTRLMRLSQMDSERIIVASGLIHIVGAGTATITASQPGDVNHNAAAETKQQTLTVDRAAQTITFGLLPTKIVGDADFDPGATSDAGLPVTYSSSNVAVATIVSGRIHTTGAGTARITAFQAGDVNHKAAASVSQSLTALPIYALSVVNGSGSGSYAVGTVVPIKADPPKASTRFDSWIGGGTSIADATASETSVTMPAAALTVMATYKGDPVTVTLSVTPDGAGTVSPVGATSVEALKPLAISAVPAKGYSFDSWSVDANGTLANSLSASTKLTPTGDCAVTANFKANEKGTRSLTVNGGAGGGAYIPGTLVAIEADAPEAGKFFDRWTGDASCVTDPLSSKTTFSMPSADVTVTASYKDATPCAVTLVVAPDGAGTVDVSAAPIYVGQTVRLTATAASGYVFVRWVSGDAAAVVDSPCSASTTATFGGSAAVTAQFAVKAPFQKAFVKTDNSKPGLDSASVTASKLPSASPFAFSPSSDKVSVLVDGFEIALDAKAGVFKQSGSSKVYTFAPAAKAAPRVRLVLDLEQGLWTMAASKITGLSKTLDNSDGVGIFLVVAKSSDADGTFRAFGDNVQMTESTSWRYAAQPASRRTGGTDMAILSLQGKYLSDKSAGSKDNLSANGTFNAKGIDFDPKTDAYPYRISTGCYKGGGFGSLSGGARYGLPLLRAYRLTKNQAYLDAASLNADWQLGANPLSRSFITGLGSRPPLHPLLMPWLYNAADVPEEGGPVAGIATGVLEGGMGASGTIYHHPTVIPPLRIYIDARMGFSICSEFDMLGAAETGAFYGTLNAIGSKQQ